MELLEQLFEDRGAAAEEIARLREALEFYGAAETWIELIAEVMLSGPQKTDISTVVVDGCNIGMPGKRAREALKP